MRNFQKGDRVKIVGRESFNGSVGTVNGKSGVSPNGDCYWVDLDELGTGRRSFLHSYLELIPVSDDDKHLMSLTPGQKEVYLAACALSEAQKRFEKALENIDK